MWLNESFCRKLRADVRDATSNRDGEGGLPCPFLKIEIKCPDFRRGKMHWLCSSTSSVSHLKCCFESILEKKLWNVFLRGLSFMCCKWNVYRSALIQRNLTCPEKSLGLWEFTLNFRCVFHLSKCEHFFIILIYI